MTTVTERPEALPTAGEGRTRGLIITVVILAVALLGLGVWAVYDATAEPETAVTEEIQQLMDEYDLAWENDDAETFLSVVTEDFTMRSERYGSWSAEQQAAVLDDAIHHGWHSEVIGEPIMTGDGPWYVAQVTYLTTTDSLLPEEGVYGISTLKIVEADGVLKVGRHTFSAEFYE